MERQERREGKGRRETGNKENSKKEESSEGGREEKIFFEKCSNAGQETVSVLLNILI